MKILVDSNVALDYMLQREPFFDDAERVVALVSGKVEIMISASVVTDVFYITRRHLGEKKQAMTALKKLLFRINVATVSEDEIHQAIALDWSDFEDAVQYVSGRTACVDFIVTRDKKNYCSASIPVVSPDELLALLQA